MISLCTYSLRRLVQARQPVGELLALGGAREEVLGDEGAARGDPERKVLKHAAPVGVVRELHTLEKHWVDDVVHGCAVVTGRFGNKPEL